jgi:alpha,alpha-trehalase
VRTRRSISAVLVAAALSFAYQAQRAPASQLRELQDYIHDSWATLTRSNRQLAQSAVDPKFGQPPSGRWPVYVARSENRDRIGESLARLLPERDFNRIEIRQLPANASEVRQPGLLFLPFSYVVPGGRFNEMYGWDSYFIQLGLLRDNRLELAKSMTDNFLYEIQHYEKILNANRTYYLTRSQPPFLTEMILSVYAKRATASGLREPCPTSRSITPIGRRSPT